MGEVHEVDLPTARIRYSDEGAGPPVVFVHGLMVNGRLWRKVVPGIVAAGFRCVTPDWPMGAHSVPVPDADLRPPGVAGLVGDFLERMGLDDVTLVANDTGGAVAQILMTQRPQRIGRVVLTSCDSFERFFPPIFAPLQLLARVPGATTLVVQSLRLRALHRLPSTYGWATKRRIPRDVIDSYLLPSRRDAAIRTDLRRFVRGVHRRYTLAAAQELPAFTKPVLLAWASEDRLFPPSLAHRLAERLPNAQVTLIDDCYTFIPEDRPEALTQLIVDFAGARRTA